MSLRPIDMTITLQRAPEINRNQTGENVRPEVAQQQFADKINREVHLQDQHITQTNKTEDGKVDRDGRGNDGGGSASNRKKREKKEDHPSKPSTTSSSMFDISI